MRIRWAATLRHLRSHPAQLLLAVAGLTLGVATIAAVDMATASAGRAFELSIDALNGAATHEIVGGPAGIDETVYARLAVAPTGIALAPIVEGYVQVGPRSLQLVGIDPFASPDFRGGGFIPEDGARWFTEPGTVIMAASTAASLGVTAERSFTINVSGRSFTARLLAARHEQAPGDDALILTDIAQAQEWLALLGKLSRIAVRVQPGANGAQALQELERTLPPGLELRAARRRSRENLALAATFNVNLQAMSLLALCVGFFLIYGAVSFAVVQRRGMIAILRALGATRAELLVALLGEALVIGVLGSVLGLLSGAFLGRVLVRLVAGTINDLYFVVAVQSVVLPPLSIVKALIAGVTVALVAAAVPALEAANAPPQLGMRRSVLETKAAGVSRWLVLASALLGASALIIVSTSTRSLLAGFVALFCLLLSVAALAPAALRTLASAAARVAGEASPIVRLALADIGASLSRTGVAVAALSLAVCAMIGVALMIDSFRESLSDWLAKTLRADIYVSAPGPGFGRPERRIDPQVLASLVAAPGIVAHSESRRVRLDTKNGPLALDALTVARGDYDSIQLSAGEPARVWAAFERGALVISEPLAWRLGVAAGETIELPTPSGPRGFAVAGVYREYGNDSGTAMMSRAVYQRIWHDDAVSALGLYVARDAAPRAVLGGLDSAVRGRQALLIRSNTQLRELSMRIFERTFVITRVLYWLTAGVAALSLISALLAWELERARELALLRALGMTRRSVAFLVQTQTLFMGAAALLAALPAGVLTAMMLIDVVNRRAFGWQIDLHLRAGAFAAAAGVALSAAFVAGVYPAWRSAQVPLAQSIREE